MPTGATVLVSILGFELKYHCLLSTYLSWVLFPQNPHYLCRIHMEGRAGEKKKELIFIKLLAESGTKPGALTHVFPNLIPMIKFWVVTVDVDEKTELQGHKVNFVHWPESESWDRSLDSLDQRPFLGPTTLCSSANTTSDKWAHLIPNPSCWLRC